MRLLIGFILLLFAVDSIHCTDEEACTADGDCGSGELKSHFMHTEDDISKENTKETEDKEVEQKDASKTDQDASEAEPTEEKVQEVKKEDIEEAAAENNEEAQKEESKTEEDASEAEPKEEKVQEVKEDIEEADAENNEDVQKEEPKTDQDASEKIEEVEGILSGCTVTNEDGQLYKLMILEAGYVINSSTLMKKHHCLPDEDIFMKNGFFQTIGHLDDEEVAIVAMMPSQALQAHAHDTDEVVEVRYGEMTEMMWPDGPGQPETKIVKEGQTSYMHSGFTHAIFAGPEGLVYHEKPETFFERRTWFAPT